MKQEIAQSKIVRGLAQSDIFKGIDEEILVSVSAKAYVLNYKADEIIVWEGEPSDKLFLINNGIVAVKKVIKNAADKIYAYSFPGNTFGEVGILENKPRSATVSALTDVEVTVFERDDFLNVLNQFPKVTIQLAKLLGYYLIESNKRLARGDAEKKVVLVLDAFNTIGAVELGRRMAAKLRFGTDKSTVYAEYPDTEKISTDLGIVDFDAPIYKHECGVDILLNNNFQQSVRSSNLALVVDNLLNDFDNIVIYMNKDISENITSVLSNVNQIILVGSSDPDQWLDIFNMHQIVKSEVKSNDTKIFTILIDTESRNNIDIEPPPDFQVVFSKDTTNNQMWSWSKGMISGTFENAVDTFVDRLQRSNNIGIFIPTTINVNISADTTPYIDMTLNFLGERFGGATSEEAKGIWSSEEVGLVGEKMFKVHAYATSKDLKKFMDEIIEFVKTIKKELKQEAMAMEINQKLTLI